MDRRRLWTVVIIIALATLGIGWFLLAPAGRDAVEAIDHTAGEVTGKRAVDQYEPIRSEVEDISAGQKDRLRAMQLDRSAETR
jgi:hypothetical protein